MITINQRLEQLERNFSSHLETATRTVETATETLTYLLEHVMR
jgi:hypothetical protein